MSQHGGMTKLKSNIPTIGPVVIPKLVNFSLSSLFESLVTSSVSSNFNLDLRVGISMQEVSTGEVKEEFLSMGKGVF